MQTVEGGGGIAVFEVMCHLAVNMKKAVAEHLGKSRRPDASLDLMGSCRIFPMYRSEEAMILVQRTFDSRGI